MSNRNSCSAVWSPDPVNAPGVLGVYRPAATHIMRRSISNDSGPLVETQDWVFRSRGGEHVEMHINSSEVSVSESVLAKSSSTQPNFRESPRFRNRISNSMS